MRRLLAAAAALPCFVSLACGSPDRPAPAAAAPPTAPAALVAAIDRELAVRPSDGALLYLRGALAAESGDRAAALDLLGRLDRAGWDIPLEPDDFAALTSDPSYRAVAARVAARAVRVHRSTVAFTVPEPDLVPEGIAVDPATRTFYLGSIRHRKILAIDTSGRVSTFVPDRSEGLLGPLGLKVDGARGLLWVASHGSRTMLGHAEDAAVADSVYAFGLADGRLRRRVRFSDPGDHLPNDFAIAGDGAVFVTDSEAGRVYRIPPDRDALEPLVPAGTYVYPNGIAMAADGRLYVAHLTGIDLLDPNRPSSSRTKRVESTGRAPLGGIDGLLREGGTLLAVQNSIGAPRVIAFQLDSSGERVTGATVLENDDAALEIPTTSCVLDGALYTIANSQIRAFRPGGAAERGELEPPRILRTPLGTESSRETAGKGQTYAHGPRRVVAERETIDVPYFRRTAAVAVPGP